MRDDVELDLERVDGVWPEPDDHDSATTEVVCHVSIDPLNAVLLCVGGDAAVPLAKLCACVEVIATTAGREPAEMVTAALEPFQESGAVTIRMSDDGETGAEVTLDLSKSKELRERAEALEADVARALQAGEAVLADCQYCDAPILCACMSAAVTGPWGQFTRKAIVEEAWGRLINSAESARKPDGTLRLRKQLADPGVPNTAGETAPEIGERPAPEQSVRASGNSAGDGAPAAVEPESRPASRRRHESKASKILSSGSPASTSARQHGDPAQEKGKIPAQTEKDPVAPTPGAVAESSIGAGPPVNSEAVGVAPGLPVDPVLAELFPYYEANDEEFEESIRKNGQLVAGKKYEGKILDGRRRERACLKQGIEPKFEEWDGNGSKVDVILSLNCRRHLSESQRAMVAARAITKYKEEAHERMLAGKAADPPRHDEEGGKGEAADLVARKVGVDRDLVYKAQTVLKNGIPELRQAVDTGQISVSGAALLATLDKKAQRKVVVASPAAIKQKIKEIRKAKKTPKRNQSQEPAPENELPPPASRGDTTGAAALAGHPAEVVPPEQDEPRSDTTEQQDEGSRTAAPGEGQEGAPKGPNDLPLALPGGQHAVPDRGVMAGKEPGGGKSKGGETEAANTEATARGTASQSSEAAAKGLSPGGLQRAVDASNRLLEPYDRGCPELGALPGPERERLTTALGLLQRRAKNRLEELAQIGGDVAEKKNTYPATAE
jgi:hypothetical protein